VTACAATGAADPAAHRVTFGRVSLIAPPGTLDRRPLRWPHGPHELGSDSPSWPAGLELDGVEACA
jgi:hypothetical protein